MPDDPKPDPPETTPDPKPDPEPKPDPTPDPKPDPKPDEPFDKERAMATIRAQRASEDKLKAELKDAREKAGRWDEHEQNQLSDKEKAEREAAEAQQKVQGATDKLRRANLLGALAEGGLTGARGKAAARLLDAVEYDDSDEPTNLEDALKRASDEFGEEMFKGGKPTPPSLDGGDGGDGEKAPALTAEEQQFADAFGMTAKDYAAFKDKTPPVPEETKT